MQLLKDTTQRTTALTFTERELWSAHRRLAAFNRDRLNPKFPSDHWESEIQSQTENLILEQRVLIAERAAIQAQARTAPRDPASFITWFEALKENGPGQKSSLFPWLAETANHEEMKWFIKQEVAGEAGFEDLTALAQLKLAPQPKLEMARNYWDEMGRGREPGMHGPMLSRVAKEFELNEYDLDEIVPEALALGNVLLGMAMNRRYAYHIIGALGVVELTAPGRAQLVYEGLKRLGVSPEAQRYYMLHSTLDIKHSEDWNRDVLRPLLDENPDIGIPIAEGALMRLNAGARCFVRYQRKLWGLSH